MSAPPNEAKGPRPVFARHAASLLVVRHAASGPEVLMGVRGAGHRFMPNRLVFPGGAVDPGDAAAPAASEPSPGLMAMLGRNAGPRLARGIAMAAARELREEAGISLGPGADGPLLDAMDYLCRAVTPPESPIRFNARFLVVAAEHVSGTPRDTNELHGVAFRRVDDVVDAGLMPVTREVLLRLSMWLALPAPARERRTALDVFKRKRWLSE